MKAKYWALLMGCAMPLAHAQTAPPSKFQVNANTQLELFGIFDVAVGSYSAAGSGTQTKLEPDGNQSSRLGIRGSSDLGDGLKINLWLEAAMGPDSGVGGTLSEDNTSAATGGGGLTWGRRSTVGLQGSWGEVRLGRDYVPTFSNLSSMHPFGTNGLGSAGQLFYPVAAGGTTARTNVRASNSVGYFLPANSGGFYGAAMTAMGEQSANSSGNYAGLRLGYKVGALDVAGATGQTNYTTGDFTQSNVGVSYTVGPAKLMYLWGQNKVGSTETVAQMLGTQYALGAGQVRLAYTDLKATGVASDANQVSLGYVHKMKNGASWYTTVSQVQNKGVGKSFRVGGAASVTTPGGDSNGVEVGLQYSF
jgi:hypothetical protein